MSQPTSASGGRLVLAATPIGNLGDASSRLIEALRTADVVAGEDTRTVARLCRGLGVTPTGKVVSYHEHNEADRAERLVETMRAGGTVLLTTDAGMPSVSDPGFRVVGAAVAAGIPVTCLPGPSAVLMALAVSGLPTDRFCFEGFLPRKEGERARALADLAAERRTMVFFEAPHRLAVMLAALADAFGADRPAAACRELTKTFEEVVRGTLGELAEWAGGEVRGEICVVVGGAAPATVDLPGLIAEARARVEAGERLKDVAGELATTAGISSKSLYDAVVASRRA